MPEYIWAETLAPYNPTATCRKCGKRAETLYHPIHTTGFPCETRSTWILDDHLCRICPRCKFGWCEAPVDVKPPQSHSRQRGQLRVVRSKR